MRLAKAKVTKWLKDSYTEENISDRVDVAMDIYISGTWGDHFESEQEAYLETCDNEAEDHITEELKMEILEAFNISAEEYEKVTGEAVYSTIYQLYPDLEGE